MDSINPSIPPSSTGCVECEKNGTWWLHLRRCAECGHIGCCDSSPNQHATKHYHETAHPIMTSFEPGEDWFWDYRKNKGFLGPEIASPTSRPEQQPAPGPEGRVPPNWQDLIHE